MSGLTLKILCAVSACAAIGLLCPSLWTWTQSHFLSAKLETLEKLTAKVEKLLAQARRNDLAVEEGEYDLFNSRLSHAQECLEKAKAVVVAQPGVVNNFTGIWSDLSKRMSLAIDDVSAIEVQLLVRRILCHCSRGRDAYPLSLV
ncbi:hypothetical protein C8Q77DRAFT_1141223 [Trametes polyzona]|nr:hypothetical protein C8Q77DRAFT_1141223 [Trametes polyzona]